MKAGERCTPHILMLSLIRIETDCIDRVCGSIGKVPDFLTKEQDTRMLRTLEWGMACWPMNRRFLLKPFSEEKRCHDADQSSHRRGHSSRVGYP